jgi:3-deoxy-D-manno-octulosonate 8-phosphate phosphatase (KDO 8-P phosphatase)
MGVENKALALAEILKSLDLHSSDCAVMGDDWPDLAMMKAAGLKVCPSQAHEAIKETVHYVTNRSGGNSAVRELCDLILKSQNHYEALLNLAKS